MKENLMEIKVSTENGRVPVTIMHVDGNLDSATYLSFQAQAEELIAGGTRHILVDLAHSPFVSSAGFRAFQKIFKDLNNIHPEVNLSEEAVKKGIGDGTYKSPYLKLANLSEESKMAFSSAGFDMFLDFFDDLKKAIASF